MPGRNGGVGYRYQFNDMETDNKISGKGNSYTTKFRQYDQRLRRWKSLDPLMAEYPDMSPYVAFDNNPVYFVDPFGLEGTNPDYPNRKLIRGRHYQIFAFWFWSHNENGEIKIPFGGKYDLNNWHGRLNYYRFDFAWMNPNTGLWWEANHTASGMKVKHTTLNGFFNH
ncbi:hypothetical protein GCM10009118_22650 [Wandonia haliotis]|uniref:RHS repeat-associated core domain-containing protein n=2 Tax=Wandonia haliotis TaxID=574963 RepID=A0ABN1MRB2_9FLAO